MSELNIKLKDEKTKKIVVDIFRIFNPGGKIIFSEDAFFEITDKYIKFDDFVYYKNSLDLKIKLYEYFSKKYCLKSDWGIITGTKPLKLLNKYTFEEMKEKFFISESKIDLLEKVNMVQSKYEYDKHNINLYINIPFCPTRCSYCSFPTIIYHNKDRRDEYVKYLLMEINSLKEKLSKRNVRTIYFGGGTPTSLETYQIREIFNSLDKILDLKKIQEFTVEAGREDTLNEEKLILFKEFGVNRISINPQTFNEKTLKLMGRKQDNKNLINIYEKAKNMGFSINMDLIIGLTGESVYDVKNTLKIIEKLNPDNLTIHTLSIKKGSKLSESDECLDFERNNIENALNLTFDFTKEKDYFPYYLYRQKEILGNFENIGYSKLGKECLYNIIINEELESVLGIGMTSNSKIFKNGKLIKFRNPKNIDDYIKNLSENIDLKNEIL